MCVMLSGCYITDKTHIPTEAGSEQGPDMVLLHMCNKPQNQHLYQCKEICKEWYCKKPE